MYARACLCGERLSYTMSLIVQRVSNRVPLTAKDGGGESKLTHEDEKKLIEYAQDRASKGIGFSKSNFFRFAGDLAYKRGTPFKNGCPSDKWWRLLKKRHNDISLRTPESTAAIRHEIMTEERVKPYFQSLKSELDENELGQCYMEYGRDIHNIGN